MHIFSRARKISFRFSIFFRDLNFFLLKACSTTEQAVKLPRLEVFDEPIV